MIRVFSKNKNINKLVFVTKSDRFNGDDKYSIILAPEFYWVKKVKLPVKKISDAKKLAPSVYDGNLPDGNYSYEIRKYGDEFIVIAYDKNKITKQLEEIFHDKTKIKDTYFAQDVLKSVNECTSINEKTALSNIDGIIIQVPRKCINTSTTIQEHLKEAQIGKNKIKLIGSGEEILEKKDLYLIFTILGILVLSSIIEYIAYKKEIISIHEKRVEIINDSKLPSTMYQLKSIQKTLTKKFTEQKEIREFLYTISKIKLSDNDYIEKIDLNSEEVFLAIHLSNTLNIDKIKSSISKIANIKSSNLNGNILNVRIGL